MRIAFGWSSIDVRSWASKHELLDFMARHKDRLLIGESVEQEAEFYSAAIVREFGLENPFVVGVCSEGHGVTPQILTLPARSLCLFGVNREIVAVDVQTRRIAYRVALGFLFRTVAELPDLGLLLLLHETGAKAIRGDGTEVWSVSRDVVEDVRLEGSNIHFDFMDSDPMILDVVNGKELARTRP